RGSDRGDQPARAGALCITRLRADRAIHTLSTLVIGGETPDRAGSYLRPPIQSSRTQGPPHGTPNTQSTGAPCRGGSRRGNGDHGSDRTPTEAQSATHDGAIAAPQA